MNRKKLRSRLRSKKGETLVETLVGVLIVAMASSIIFAGVATSVRVNQEAQEKRKELQFTYGDTGVVTDNEAATVAIVQTDPTGSFSGNLAVTEHTDENGYVWFELK